MNCFNCGQESNEFLCKNCLEEDILDKIYHGIALYKPEDCQNQWIYEYAECFESFYEFINCIPSILELFDFSISEYYYCCYYRLCRDSRFEDAALCYLDSHPEMSMHSQTILNHLLDSYLRNDFVKPKKWCTLIMDTDDLYCELYIHAAQFFAMTAEYDFADNIIDKALGYCQSDAYPKLLFRAAENVVDILLKLQTDNLRYRAKRPYWPTTEQRRIALIPIYDEKGISYPRITVKPMKIKECDFTPIREALSMPNADYCAFWCAQTFAVVSTKGIYQIAAVKVRDGIVVDNFHSLVKPWDGKAAKKAAAKEAGISIENLESADDVDLVMTRFFAFVQDDVLLATGALGNQAKLISRAARYSGICEISNSFFDLLDYAADVSDQFDMENNTRDYLLQYFHLSEGANAFEKASQNVALYTRLKKMDQEL